MFLQISLKLSHDFFIFSLKFPLNSSQFFLVFPTFDTAGKERTMKGRNELVRLWCGAFVLPNALKIFNLPTSTSYSYCHFCVDFAKSEQNRIKFSTVITPATEPSKKLPSLLKIELSLGRVPRIKSAVHRRASTYPCSMDTHDKNVIFLAGIVSTTDTPSAPLSKTKLNLISARVRQHPNISSSLT